MDMNILDETFVYVWLHTENVNVIIMNICTLRKNKKKQKRKKTECIPTVNSIYFYRKYWKESNKKNETENSKRTEEKCITSVFRLKKDPVDGGG